MASARSKPRVLEARLWFFQIVVLLVLGAALLAVPQLVPALTFDQTTADALAIQRLSQNAGGDPELAITARMAERIVQDAARLQGPLLLGLAGFTVFALMQGQSRKRRLLARLFTLGIGAWLLGIAWDPLCAVRSPAELRAALSGISPWGWVVFGLVGAMGLTNAVIGWRGDGPEPIEEKMRGSANTLPPGLWTLFLLQGLFFLGMGVFLSLDPDWAVGLLTRATGDWSGALSLVRGRYLAIGSSWMSMGLISFYAASLRSEWSWRSVCVLFCLWMTHWVLVEAWIYDRDTYRWPFFSVVGLLMLAFVLGHIVALGGLRQLWAVIGHSPPLPRWKAQTAENGVEAWLWRDLLLGPGMLMQTRKSRGRATHHAGVGGRGQFVASPEEGVPPNAFFTPGRSWPVRFRFANLTRPDDRDSDIRGFSISLRDESDQPAFDVLANSGPLSAVAHLLTFMAFALTKASHRMSTRLLSRDIVAREASIAGARLGPSSYLAVHYYSQIVRYWIDHDGTRWRVRYRLRPLAVADRTPLPVDAQSGLLPPHRADQVWVREAAQGDERPSYYLVDELKERLRVEPQRFVFEAQFDRASGGDSEDWYNSTVDWPERCHPWLRVGELTLSQVLPAEVVERMQFNGGNHPPTLPVPASNAVTDYRSLGDSEGRVIARLQRVRASLRLPTFREPTE